MNRLGVFALALVTACSATISGIDATTDQDADPTPASIQPGSVSTSPIPESPPAPDVPAGPLDPDTEAALLFMVDRVFSTAFTTDPLDEVVAAGDARAAWVIADLLRFQQGGGPRDDLVAAFTALTGADRGSAFGPDFVWTTNLLIAWDLPAWEGYPELKRRLYATIYEGWDRFFREDHGVDWRLITWGGVLPDDRPFGDNRVCNCIPSLDDPATTDAAGGTWYPDDRIVFGVVVNGEALALPKNQMEVHEMANLTLGDRQLGIPYCTLCGSPQAYYTDNVPGTDRVVLRTSGLLSRSNKVMYDVNTWSMFNTFTGQALTGPLGEAGVVLEQVSVVTSTWGDWKLAHSDTRIIAEDGGIGFEYPLDPLGGRDANGPIFPVGDVDPRLAVQELVVGVIAPDGTAVAFPLGAATLAIAAGDEVTLAGLTVRQEGGLRVYDSQGNELVSHQAYWFAWSQFNPETLVWSP
ncbi:MAG: DUF3179 domain-containing (seleno)protein [Acidimicrobiia bacterium]